MSVAEPEAEVGSKSPASLACSLYKVNAKIIPRETAGLNSYGSQKQIQQRCRKQNQELRKGARRRKNEPGR
jgi:hypothetical protein